MRFKNWISVFIKCFLANNAHTRFWSKKALEVVMRKTLVYDDLS